MSNELERPGIRFLEHARGGLIGEPISTNDPERIAKSRLSNISNRQLYLQKIGRFSEYSKDPFKAFTSDPEYMETFNMLLPYIENDYVSESEVFGHEIRRGAIGKMLETIAHRTLSSRYSKSGERILISPEDTFRVFKSLHPESNIKKFEIQETLQGVSVPDGLSLDLKSKEVKEVIEYKTTITRQNGIEMQLSKLLAEMRKTKFLRNARINLVFPEQVLPSGFRDDFKEIIFTELPFKREKYLEFFRKVNESGILSLGLTADAKDIEERLHRQDITAGMLLRSHNKGGFKIDRHWVDYARNRAKKGIAIDMPLGVDVLLQD